MTLGLWPSLLPFVASALQSRRVETYAKMKVLHARNSAQGKRKTRIFLFFITFKAFVGKTDLECPNVFFVRFFEHLDSDRVARPRPNSNEA